MFISNTEKSIINARLEFLEAKVSSLTTMLTQATAHQPVEVKRKGKPWGEKSKLAASERMKKYWADKKATKEQA